MKSFVLNISILLVSLPFLGSCAHSLSQLAEQNIANEDLSLSKKGECVIRYDAATMQIGYNKEKNEYRVHDDNMGQYFILTCSEMPSGQGQTVKANLQYTTSDNTVTENNLSFEVQKTDDSGKIWLWNKSKKYGIVIKQL